LQFLSSYIIFNLIEFGFWFAVDAKEEFKTQVGIDVWRPWTYKHKPWLPKGQKNGGSGSGGSGSRGNVVKEIHKAEVKKMKVKIIFWEI
jgi:hypothetical protein